MPRTSLTKKELHLPLTYGTLNKVVAKLTDHDVSLDAAYGVAADWAPVTVAAPGAIDPTKRITRLSIDATDAFTLANPPAGTPAGYKILVTVIAGTSVPVGTITPATPVNHTNVTALGVIGDFVEYIWTGSAWLVGANQGVTVTP